MAEKNLPKNVLMNTTEFSKKNDKITGPKPR